jgi:hypothetical protein
MGEIGPSPPGRAAALEASAIGNIHRDFHTEPEINGLRGFPFHTRAPDIDSDRGSKGLPPAAIFPDDGVGRKAIIMKLAS